MGRMAALLLLLSLVPCPSYTENYRTTEDQLRSPTQVVRAFYDALQRGDCATAHKLRPGYARTRCHAIQDVQLRKLTLVRADSQRPVVYIEVAYTIQDERGPHREVFIGYVALRAQQGSLVIEGDSYTSTPPRSSVSSRQTISPPTHGAAELAPQVLPQLPPQGAGLTFGSKEILTRLWSVQQLQNDPQEDQPIRRLAAPNHAPPRKYTLQYSPRAYRPRPTPPYAVSNSRRTTKWSP